MTVPIWYTGTVVVMDSGFCVAAGIIKLLEKGVFGQALIKKRKYWPKLVPGDHIDEYMKSKEVRECDALNMASATTTPGETSDKWHIFCMKEPDYVMKVMSTHGTLEDLPDKKTRRTFKNASNQSVTKIFPYKEPFGLHYKFRHQVDDHNNRRHQPISIERSWATKYWPDRNFAHYIALSEVNTNLAWAYFRGEDKEHQLRFRKQLAKEMLVNSLIDTSSVAKGKAKRKRKVEHTLVTAPLFTGSWNSSEKRWNKVAAKYQQHTCSATRCKRQIRTYCNCDKSTFFCTDHFVEHVKQVDD
jgi:hypothetical protein